MNSLAPHHSWATSGRYKPPRSAETVSLNAILAETGRHGLETRQMEFLQPSGSTSGDVTLRFVGDLALLRSPTVSIVGTRDVSDAGRLRARRLARELAEASVLVMSGLAKGVDTAAHTSAIESGGKTAAVIGTPLDKAYPSENARLQEEIYTQHLLISPFREGEPTYRSSFPKRNRVMAALSDATVIVEASDSSGTLHQATECGRLGRWLFIMRSVAEDPSLSWPKKFLGTPKVAVLSSTRDILDVIER